MSRNFTLLLIAEAIEAVVVDETEGAREGSDFGGEEGEGEEPEEGGEDVETQDGPVVVEGVELDGGCEDVGDDDEGCDGLGEGLVRTGGEVRLRRRWRWR